MRHEWMGGSVDFLFGMGEVMDFWFLFLFLFGVGIVSFSFPIYSFPHFPRLLIISYFRIFLSLFISFLFFRCEHCHNHLSLFFFCVVKNVNACFSPCVCVCVVCVYRIRRRTDFKVEIKTRFFHSIHYMPCTPPPRIPVNP